jgi:Flp pilus assembly protein CpaB
MRASTLFALTVAVLLGLAVAITARYTGFFASPVVEKTEVKKADIQVLVAARNLFANDMIDGTGTRVRLLRPDEVANYEKARDQYLPPVPQAATLRIAAKNIYADQPILKEHLKDMVKPEALNTRLLPYMRAVSVSLPRDRSAGGLIQVGEWVDVFLTSEVQNEQTKAVRTACIVPKARVISKRNTLWPIFAPLPEGKPVEFTLEVNPYRAALIELTRSKGDFTFAPLGSAEQRQLEVQRERLLQDPDATPQVHFLPPDTPEADDEDLRVASYSRGEMVVSDADLIRIFGLRTPPPPVNTISVERMYGISRFEPAVFTTNGVRVDYASKKGSPDSLHSTRLESYDGSSIQFRPKDCPTCKKKKMMSK